MIYITTALNFLSNYTKLLITAMFVMYGTYVAVNLLFGQYRGHNRAIIGSIAKLRQTASTGKIVPFVASVPLMYRGQWHCYTTAHNVPAVSMFTPIQPITRRRVVPLLWGSVLVAISIVALLILNPYNNIAMYSLVAYIVVQWPISSILHSVSNRKYNRACRLFGRWTALVQAYFGMGDTAVVCPAKADDVEDMIQQLQLVRKCDKSVVAGKVASILGSQPQNVERTVSQQRRINHVLNDLLVTGINKTSTATD